MSYITDINYIFKIVKNRERKLKKNIIKEKKIQDKIHFRIIIHFYIFICLKQMIASFFIFVYNIYFNIFICDFWRINSKSQNKYKNV